MSRSSWMAACSSNIATLAMRPVTDRTWPTKFGAAGAAGVGTAGGGAGLTSCGASGFSTMASERGGDGSIVIASLAPVEHGDDLARPFVVGGTLGPVVGELEVA